MDKKSKAFIYILLLAILVSLITCVKSVPSIYCDPGTPIEDCPQTRDFVFPGVEPFIMKTFGYYFLLCLATYVGKDMFPEDNKYPSPNILGSPKFQ
jgi:hypothetical protein